MSKRAGLFALCLLALGGQHGVRAETVAADTPQATLAGATFTVPAGWGIAANGAVTILTPPEPDAQIVLVDVAATDADAAVAAAWAAHRPEFARPLRVAMPRAARSGWEERRYYEYEPSYLKRRDA
jgi:hypothetical protein